MIPATADALFVWDREPPASFVKELAEATPQDDNLTQFLCVWEPGEPQAPIQRWVLWQMRPKLMTQKLIDARHPLVEGLTEPHPRRGAWWDEKAGHYRLKGGKTAKTDRLTWELYDKTGMYGQRWWIIQGPNGGHRWNLTSTERRILGEGSMGNIRDVPMPGDMPYADPDWRTIRHLLELQKVTLWLRIARYAEHQQNRLNAAEEAEVEQARGRFFDWMMHQLDGIYGEYMPLYKKALKNIPVAVGSKAPEPGDLGEARHRYATDT